jgi:hypothetical protein
MASMKGGQRFTVCSSACAIGLKARNGIALNHSGSPSAAGTGGGKIAASSGRHRNRNVIGVS